MPRKAADGAGSLALMNLVMRVSWIPQRTGASSIPTRSSISSRLPVPTREANMFAAELLMPFDGVTAAIDGIADGEDAVGAVVRAYAVSPKSAAIRLSELEVLDKATAAAVIDRIENDWRAFWREQRVPADDPMVSTGKVTLPEEFVRRVQELLEAQVISPERRAELLDRPLVTSE